MSADWYMRSRRPPERSKARTKKRGRPEIPLPQIPPPTTPPPTTPPPTTPPPTTPPPTTPPPTTAPPTTHTVNKDMENESEARK